MTSQSEVMLIKDDHSCVYAASLTLSPKYILNYEDILFKIIIIIV